MAGFEKLSVPVGPSSCARAATSKEAAFRIDHPLPPARNTRVVALDERRPGSSGTRLPSSGGKPGSSP
ncbi:hypothetical protein ACFQV4_29375 [Streptomyces thermocarboxydus]